MQYKYCLPILLYSYFREYKKQYMFLTLFLNYARIEMSGIQSFKSDRGIDWFFQIQWTCDWLFASMQLIKTRYDLFGIAIPDLVPTSRFCKRAEDL